MQELTLAGNMLTQLPERIGGMTALRKLQISGNSLSQLPESIGNLIRLEVGQCSSTHHLHLTGAHYPQHIDGCGATVPAM